MKVINSKISPTVISLGICFNLWVFTKLPQQWHSRSTTPAISSLIAGWILDCTWRHIAFQTSLSSYSWAPSWYGWSQLILLTSFPPLLIRLNFMVNFQPQSPLLICSPLSHQKSRQHCRLTICIELVELANSIRWQDSNNNTDTETRCLV